VQSLFERERLSVFRGSCARRGSDQNVYFKAARGSAHAFSRFPLSSDGLQYLAAYRFLFESPKWPLHLLILFVCQFIPIVGPLVMWGYLFDVIEAKHRTGAQEYPEFDFDRLGAYLVRGLWPILVAMVLAIPFIIVALPILLIFVFSRAAGNPSSEQPFIGLLMAIGILVFFVLMFAMQILVVPLILRAGLSQDFGAAFSMTFLKDFMGRVGKELLLSFLFLLVTFPFVLALGVLALCIGVYAATVIIQFAQFHLYYQLYELYLARGGTPIPLKTQ
jgi:hypothetical protein